MDNVTKKLFYSISALFIYISVSILFFNKGLLNHLTTSRLGTSTDSISFIWSYAWWLHCLQHNLNPFFTQNVWYPLHFNLTQQNVLMMGNFFLAAPIAYFFGPVVAYNLTELFASAFAAWTAFILCYYLTKSFWPSLFGGFFFGFSSYMIVHTLGHPILITVFLLPIILLISIQYYRQELNQYVFLLFFALLLALQFLISLETFATTIVFGSVAVLLTLIADKGYSHTKKFIFYLILGLFLTLLLISPYLYFFFSTPLPTNGFPSGHVFLNDLLGFVLPNSLLWIKNSTTLSLSSSIIAINECYIGLPLLILVILFAIEFWYQKITKILILFIVITAIASLGNKLHIAGIPLNTMPWTIADHLPLIKNALPCRFGLLISLALAIVVSYWLYQSNRSMYVKILLIGLSVLFYLPDFNQAKNWVNPLSAPPFITQKLYKKWLKPNEVVLILPYAQAGNGMYWQTLSHFYFNMAGGYLGYMPESFQNNMIPSCLLNLSTWTQLSSLQQQQITTLLNTQEFKDEFKSFLVKHQVSAILVDNPLPIFKQFFSKIGLHSISTGGIDLYWVKPLMQNLRISTKNMITTQYHSWYPSELFFGNQFGHWSQGKSSIIIPSSNTRPIIVKGTLLPISPRHVNMYFNGQLVKEFYVNNPLYFDKISLLLKPGKNIITFSSPEKPREPAPNTRPLSFALSNFIAKPA